MKTTLIVLLDQFYDNKSWEFTEQTFNDETKYLLFLNLPSFPLHSSSLITVTMPYWNKTYVMMIIIVIMMIVMMMVVMMVMKIMTMMVVMMIMMLMSTCNNVFDVGPLNLTAPQPAMNIA